MREVAPGFREGPRIHACTLAGWGSPARPDLPASLTSSLSLCLRNHSQVSQGLRLGAGCVVGSWNTATGSTLKFPSV